MFCQFRTTRDHSIKNRALHLLLESLAAEIQICQQVPRFVERCRRVSTADALAEQREGSCTLVLEPGCEPLATLWHGGQRHSCTTLHFLPLSAELSHQALQRLAVEG